MQEPEKTIAELITIGAIISVGKLLMSSDELTVRVIAGRAILGAATSLVAGVVLVKIPNIDPMALLGVGSALGIIGQQYIEKMLRKKLQDVLEKAEEVLGAKKDDG